MIAWVLVAWAVDKPADIDLNDLDRYSDAREQAMRGPAGCWEATGVASWAWWTDGPVADADVPFQARFESGSWSGLSPLVAFRPVVGSSAGPRSVEALAVWLEGLVGQTETSWLGWDSDRGRVELIEMQVVDGARKEAETLSRFAEGAVIETLSTTFPATSLGLGSKLKGAGYDVRFGRVEGQVVPIEESLVFRMRHGGKLVRGHQMITYRSWRPCS